MAKEQLDELPVNDNAKLSDQLTYTAKCMLEYKDQLTKAKELIKRLIKVTYGEGWNYSLQVKVEAEQFLKECE